MILSRRQTHLVASSTLAIALPLILLLGFLFRPQYLPVDASAEILFQQDGYVAMAQEPMGKQVATAVLEARNPFNATTYLQDDGQMMLALKPRRDMRQPDLLVYWDGSSDEPTEISDQSLLLGRLSGPARRLFTVPEAVVGQAGYLLIYSQGKQSLEAALPVTASLTQL